MKGDGEKSMIGYMCIYWDRTGQQKKRERAILKCYLLCLDESGAPVFYINKSHCVRYTASKQTQSNRRRLNDRRHSIEDL